MSKIDKDILFVEPYTPYSLTLILSFSTHVYSTGMLKFVNYPHTLPVI